MDDRKHDDPVLDGFVEDDVAPEFVAMDALPAGRPIWGVSASSWKQRAISSL